MSNEIMVFNPAGGGGLSGLTPDALPKATSSTTLGDSRIRDDGSLIKLGSDDQRAQLKLDTDTSESILGDADGANNNTKLTVNDADESISINKPLTFPDGSKQQFAANSTFVDLTDAAEVAWDMAAGANAKVTLGGNRALAINNVQSGMTGTLIVVQDATGLRTLALPDDSLVVNGGAGAIELTATADARDIISFVYDGEFFYWAFGLQFN